MKSVKYLESVKEKHSLKSDRQLALFLKKGTNTISQYMTGARVMDEETCLAVAMALEIDPLQVLMAAGIDRAEKTGQRSLWSVFSTRTTRTAAIGLAIASVNFFLTPTPSEAAQLLDVNGSSTLHYVKYPSPVIIGNARSPRL
ncbi:MAG: Cro/Cl family transcriptional regulator [Burkholderiaceae bacterium]